MGVGEAGRTGVGFPRPRVVVSRCLGFDHCRYDGSVIAAPEVGAMAGEVEFITVCPEMAIGLPSPRQPLRLVGDRLVQPATGRDFTEPMLRFAEEFLSSLPPVDGFILKNRSPSCGISDAKVYASVEKGTAIARRAGMFGGAVRERFPDHPIEDEGRLTNRSLREAFLTAIFALASLRQVEAGGRMRDLVEFHAHHKLLLLALGEARMRELGRIVANADRLPSAEVFRRYRAAFQAALRRPLRRPSAANALLHAFGYVSDGLSPGERAYFLETLAAYRAGRVPLSTPVGVLRAWIVRFDVPYLADQRLFFPFPSSLLSPEDSGGGREPR
ncbi:MAG: DUF523 and DUF1722 domain-containing protein [Candidatus Bipolaricaulota bacterium]|nr:DUF523 and DUF1722 domain-containing protein [Candidatus Bipolaricaulota bacterium]